MLAELVSFGDAVSLIMSSGVQFMDFGLTIDPRKQEDGHFLPQSSPRSLSRLEYDERKDRWVHPANPDVPVRPTFAVPMADSLALLDGRWLPIPFLALGPDRRFADGPTTWARARLIALAPGEDVHGNTHRVTLAFDTTVFAQKDGVAYLAPTSRDVQSGAAFRLAHRAHDMGWFPSVPWIDEWVRELYLERAAKAFDLDQEEVDQKVASLEHHAHYLNLLSVLGERVRPPEIRVRGNAEDEVYPPIPVDMVLDVGNSRTCGILIEEHPQQDDGLKKRYQLALRDLSEPQRTYSEPFESRVEFAQAVLGKNHLACKSGRNDAFVWPTIARVGPEASRLSGRRRGTEGSTGLSSPKRYLWDEDPFAAGWRFNTAGSLAETEPLAVGAPFSNLVNDQGRPLYAIDDPDESLPVFSPRYSRSSLMTFMLAEVLVQALTQMNSPAQRLSQGDPQKPRHLRTVILTVPPAMPKPEREIFEARMEHALALVWKGLGWHPEEDPMDDEGRARAWPPLPRVHVQWDEATCAQAVYLFSETHEHFGGRPEEFFRVMRRPGTEDSTARLTVASIDIGGGTTDLVVTDYEIGGKGANVYIQPEQRFRDGFKVAGDDLLLEVVQKLVVPAIDDALREHGVRDPGALLSKLIGSESVRAQHASLRQQFTQQVLYPLGLRILQDYESYDPLAGAEVETRTFRDLLPAQSPPSDRVLQYFAEGVRAQTGGGGADFNVLDTPIRRDPESLHRSFLEDEFELCKAIRSLCEIVYLYNCDVLLLSGRPSRLPGIQALFRAFVPLPPDRIVPLDGYRVGTWYPFHRDGRIADPKTTAAVGAMICKVAGARGIPNFGFLANAFKPYSTVRYIGLVDQNLLIKDDDVYYREVDLNDPDPDEEANRERYELPETPFEVRTRMVLGYRQLNSPRWPASPLYVVELGDKVRRHLEQADRSGKPDWLMVKLKRARADAGRRGGRKAEERFVITEVISHRGHGFNPRSDISLKLNTLITVGIGENTYWLDTGSVIR